MTPEELFEAAIAAFPHKLTEYGEPHISTSKTAYIRRVRYFKFEAGILLEKPLMLKGSIDLRIGDSRSIPAIYCEFSLYCEDKRVAECGTTTYYGHFNNDSLSWELSMSLDPEDDY